MTLRTRLQAAFVVLGGAAIALTDWQAMDGATGALRQATYDRLTTVRSTQAIQLERFFADVRNQVAALAADDSTISALEQFGAAAPGSAAFERLNSRYQPAFERFQTAFGLYDIFLIDGGAGRVLYTVKKEPDLGVVLTAPPHNATGLARAYAKALSAGDEPVIEDYTPYTPSGNSPAAFVAARVRRGGQIIGVLAAQLSIAHVDRVMSAASLGETGQAYLVGPDQRLRSDFRFPVESANPPLPPDLAAQIQRNKTSVLVLPVNLDSTERIQEGAGGMDLGRSFRGQSVLRSQAPLTIPGLQWTIVAEIEAAEALEPVSALRNRILFAGLAVAAVFFVAAGWLSASITKPLLAVAAAARRLGLGDPTARVPVASNDEIGQLAADFNRMREDLQRTTVSKTELQKLAGRLITAQEDERSRVARELHDDLTQRVAALAIEAGRLEKVNDASPDQIRGSLSRLKEQMGRVAEDVHGIARRLHPAMLDDLGLVAAIEAECRSFLERTEVPVDQHIEGRFDHLRKDIRLAVYRIVQEALRNIHRHSGATEVTLFLSNASGAVSMEIRDNGRGFDRSSAAAHSGLGLQSMEERVRLLGGEIEIVSEPGSGTSIAVRLSLESRVEET